MAHAFNSNYFNLLQNQKNKTLLNEHLKHFSQYKTNKMNTHTPQIRSHMYNLRKRLRENKGIYF